MEFSFQSVTKRNWRDLETLFESTGGPHYCWCTLWRDIEDRRNLKKSEKKQCLQRYVDQGEMVGILAYEGSRPIGWCSLSPRSGYRKLGSKDSLPHVWSIVCFFIAKPFRNQGLMTLFIKEAISFSRMNGAHYLEAFPVSRDSPSYRFMGFVSTFAAAGFQIVDQVGARRHHALKSLL